MFVRNLRKNIFHSKYSDNYPRKIERAPLTENLAKQLHEQV